MSPRRNRRRLGRRTQDVYKRQAWAKATFGPAAIYTGLIYPIAVCLVTFVVGTVFIKETQTNSIDV